MRPLLFVLVFLATALATEAILSLLRTRRNREGARLRNRLKALTRRAQSQAQPRDRQESILRGVRGGARASLLDTVLAAFPSRRRLEGLIYRAGMRVRVERFVALSVALALGGWLLVSALLDDSGIGLCGLAVGLAPWATARLAASRRMRAFEEQFPEALDLLTRALRAGHSLGVGLQLVGDELPDPVGSEFALAAEEIKLGLETRQALVNLSERVANPDLPYFVTAVLIQRETGGSLAELLENLGGLIRKRAQFHGKLRAMTAQGRMTAGVLAVWPAISVALLMWMRPDYVRPLVETRSGHLALLAAATLSVIGYLIARRLAEVRV